MRFLDLPKYRKRRKEDDDIFLGNCFTCNEGCDGEETLEIVTLIEQMFLNLCFFSDTQYQEVRFDIKAC